VLSVASPYTALVCPSGSQGRVVGGAAHEQPPGHQGGDRRPQRQLHGLHRAGQGAAGQEALRLRGGRDSADGPLPVSRLTILIRFFLRLLDLIVNFIDI